MHCHPPHHPLNLPPFSSHGSFPAQKCSLHKSPFIYFRSSQGSSSDQNHSFLLHTSFWQTLNWLSRLRDFSPLVWSEVCLHFRVCFLPIVVAFVCWGCSVMRIERARNDGNGEYVCMEFEQEGVGREVCGLRSISERYLTHSGFFLFHFLTKLRARRGRSPLFSVALPFTPVP